MKKNMFVLELSFALALVGSAAMGCNTIHGVGEDIEKGGEAIQDTSQDVQR